MTAGGGGPVPMKLQEFLFREALAEIGISGGRVDIDHEKGICRHDSTGPVPVTFPMRIVRRVAMLSKAKHCDFAFMGVITPHRQWILKYPNVAASRYGRNPQSKYIFHEDYYRRLCAARFGISPTGECPWSYRFLESVMCHAIPVLSDTETDIYADAFFHVRDSQQKRWDAAICERNYRVLIERHTLARFGTPRGD